VLDPGAGLLNPPEGLAGADNARRDEAIQRIGVSDSLNSLVLVAALDPATAAWSSDICSGFVIGMIIFGRLVVRACDTVIGVTVARAVAAVMKVRRFMI
jgi:hypothetical protein